MNELKVMSNSKQYWEKSQTINGITKRVCVEQAENGFIVTMSKYGSTGEEGSKYIDENKKYISKKNPLEGTEPKEDSYEDKILDGLQDLEF
jgi:hypothetical protein